MNIGAEVRHFNFVFLLTNIKSQTMLVSEDFKLSKKQFLLSRSWYFSGKDTCKQSPTMWINLYRGLPCQYNMIFSSDSTKTEQKPGNLLRVFKAAFVIDSIMMTCQSASVNETHCLVSRPEHETSVLSKWKESWWFCTYSYMPLRSLNFLKWTWIHCNYVKS